MIVAMNEQKPPEHAIEGPDAPPRGLPNYRELLSRVVDEAGWSKVFQMLLDQVSEGGSAGVRAAELLLRYAFGAPGRAPEPTAERPPIQFIQVRGSFKYPPPDNELTPPMPNE